MAGGSNIRHENPVVPGNVAVWTSDDTLEDSGVKPGGSLVVQQNGTPVVNPATTINFTSGAIITAGGSGTANVAVSGGGGTNPVVVTYPPITVGVQSFDISAPAGAISGRIVISDSILSTGDDFAMAVSADGGTTFLNSTGIYEISVIAGNGAPADNTDKLVDLPWTPVITTRPGLIIELTNLGGRTSTDYFAGVTTLTGGTVAGSEIDTFNQHSGAAVAVNYLRFLPFGNGDCNPPTSGETVTVGAYSAEWIVQS